jgi:hypothetical protein
LSSRGARDPCRLSGGSRPRSPFEDRGAPSEASPDRSVPCRSAPRWETPRARRSRSTPSAYCARPWGAGSGAGLLRAGPSGGGKAFVALGLALALALAAATRQPCLGSPVEPGCVVYAAGEGLIGLARRIQTWRDAHGQPSLERFRVLPVAAQFMQTRRSRASARRSTYPVQLQADGDGSAPGSSRSGDRQQRARPPQPAVCAGPALAALC